MRSAGVLNNANPNVACEIRFKLDKKEGANAPPYYGTSIFEQIKEWGLCKCRLNNNDAHIKSGFDFPHGFSLKLKIMTKPP